MERYSEYKDSGVKWLGEIPSHWDMRKMKFTFEERREKGFPNLPLLAATQNHGVIRKQDYENRTVEATKALETLKLVEKGDFVISLRSFQGGIELSHERGIISPAYTVLRPSHISSAYFKHLGKSPVFIQLLKSMVTGIREGQNIDYGKLRENLIPIPSLGEQNAIAKYLDSVTAKIDEAIAQQQKMIDLLNERKQIIINKAVTKGLDSNVKMKPSGIDWIGEIPEHWKIRRLKFCAKTNSGSTPRSIAGKENNDSIIRWVRTTDINNDIVYDTSEYLSSKEMQSASCPLLPPKTVLISMYGGMGSFGKIGLLNMEATINQALCSINCNSTILPEYMFYYLQSIHSVWMKYAESSRKDPNLNQQTIKNIFIVIPSFEEQQSIANYVKSKIHNLKIAIDNCNKQISLLQERKQIIINDIVTGKVKVV